MKPFDAKLWAMRTNPVFGEALTLEQCVSSYLAQWAHKGCGGAPVAENQNHCVRCSACGQAWKWVGRLGDTVKKLPFRNLKVL